MRVRWLPAVATLTLLPALAAQQPAAREPGGQAEYEALAKEFRKAMTEFSKKQRAAYESGGIEALRKLDGDNPTPDFVPKFQSGAARWASTPDAIPFLTWLVTTGGSQDQAAASDALANLVVDHGDSADLEDAVLALQRSPLDDAEISEAVNEIVAANEHPNVRGAALFVRGIRVVEARDAGDEARDAALADLRSALDLAPGASFAGQAEGAIYEAEHLQVGMEAPDIVGEDLDGETFKLSDYRGKVILLDFWGDW